MGAQFTTCYAGWKAISQANNGLLDWIYVIDEKYQIESVIISVNTGKIG